MSNKYIARLLILTLKECYILQLFIGKIPEKKIRRKQKKNKNPLIDDFCHFRVSSKNILYSKYKLSMFCGSSVNALFPLQDINGMVYKVLCSFALHICLIGETCDT